MPLNDDINDRIVSHLVDLSRFNEDSRQRILKLLNKLEDELVSKIVVTDVGDVDPQTYRQKRLDALLKQSRATIADQYGMMDRESLFDLREIAKMEADFSRNVINSPIGVEVATVALSPEQLSEIASESLVFGAPSRDWWRKQSESLLSRFIGQMQMGLVQGETNDQLVKRVRGTKANDYTDGIMIASRRDATALVRTSALTVANRSRRETYLANQDVVKAVQHISTLDHRTTEICIARHGKVWSLPDYEPVDHDIQFDGGTPVHWQCRSTEIPVTRSWEEMGATPERKGAVQKRIKDAIVRNVKSLATPEIVLPVLEQLVARNFARIKKLFTGEPARPMSYGEWLSTTKAWKALGFASLAEFQESVLGAERFRMWKAGEVKLDDLIDESNRPLTVDELKERTSKLAEQEANTFVEFTEDRREAASAWGATNFAGWAKKLSDDLRGAAMRYRYTDFYRHVNDLLRRGKVKRYVDESFLYDEIRRLDRLIGSGEIPENVILYRTARLDIPFEDLVGNIYTDRGFFSTSLDPSVAKRRGGNVLFRIRMRKGWNGAFIDSAIGDLSRTDWQERVYQFMAARTWVQRAKILFSRNPSFERTEVLLPRNMKFRIVDVRTSRGKKVVELEPIREAPGAKGRKPKFAAKRDFDIAGIKLREDVGTGTEDIPRLWNRISGGIYGPDEFRDRLVDGLESLLGNPEGFKADFDMWAINEDLYYRGVVKVGDDKVVEFTRIATPDMNIHHLSMEVIGEFQERGISKLLTRNSYTVYREMGVKGVTIDASEGGSYSWARMGFVPTRESWNFLRDLIKKDGSIRLYLDRLPLSTADYIRSLLDSNDPVSIWSLADIRIRVDGELVGRHILKELFWSGKLDFGSANSKARTELYTGLRTPRPAPPPSSYRPEFDKFNARLSPGSEFDLTDEMVEGAKRSLNKIPLHVRRRLKDEGVSIEFVVGRSITDSPNYRHLSGARPPSWPEGTSWDDVPALYDPSRRTVTVTVNRMDDPRASSSADMLLHEVGHAWDDVNGGISIKGEWVDIHRNSDWSIEYTEDSAGEGFAETFAEILSGKSIDPDLPKYGFIMKGLEPPKELEIDLDDVVGGLGAGVIKGNKPDISIVTSSPDVNRTLTNEFGELLGAGKAKKVSSSGFSGMLKSGEVKDRGYVAIPESADAATVGDAVVPDWSRSAISSFPSIANMLWQKKVVRVALRPDAKVIGWKVLLDLYDAYRGEADAKMDEIRRDQIDPLPDTDPNKAALLSKWFDSDRSVKRLFRFLSADDHMLPRLALFFGYDVVDVSGVGVNRRHYVNPGMMVADKEPTVIIDSISISQFKQIEGQLGSNPGALFEDPEDKSRWYVKTFDLDREEEVRERVMSELLANDLYRLSGVRVPNTKLAAFEGKLAVASEWGESLKENGALLYGEASIGGLQDGFAADAWLANWDLGQRNVLFGPGTVPYRVDSGFSFAWKDAYPAHDWDKVIEWDLMRQAEPTASTFGRMTDLELAESARKVVAITDAQIRAAVEGRGLGDDLADTLIARREVIRAKMDEIIAKLEQAPHTIILEDPADIAIQPIASVRSRILFGVEERQVDKERVTNFDVITTEAGDRGRIVVTKQNQPDTVVAGIVYRKEAKGRLRILAAASKSGPAARAIFNYFDKRKAKLLREDGVPMDQRLQNAWSRLNPGAYRKFRSIGEYDTWVKDTNGYLHPASSAGLGPDYAFAASTVSSRIDVVNVTLRSGQPLDPFLRSQVRRMDEVFIVSGALRLPSSVVTYTSYTGTAVIPKNAVGAEIEDFGFTIGQLMRGRAEEAIKYSSNESDVLLKLYVPQGLRYSLVDSAKWSKRTKAADLTASMLFERNAKFTVLSETRGVINAGTKQEREVRFIEAELSHTLPTQLPESNFDTVTTFKSVEPRVREALRTNKFKERAMQMWQDDLVKYAGRLNRDPDEVINALHKRTSELLRAAHLYIRVDNVNGVLADGKFKSLFDFPPTPGRTLESRTAEQKNLFNVKKGAGPSERPVYGYASSSPDGAFAEEGRFSALDVYGPEVAVKLKRHIRPRATILAGDAIGAFDKQPEPVNVHGWTWIDTGTLRGKHPEDIATLDEMIGNYIEAHYFGGVTLQDVEEVIFRSPLAVDQSTVDLLSKNNVPWRILRPPTAASQLRFKYPELEADYRTHYKLGDAEPHILDEVEFELRGDFVAAYLAEFAGTERLSEFLGREVRAVEKDSDEDEVWNEVTGKFESTVLPEFIKEQQFFTQIDIRRVELMLLSGRFKAQFESLMSAGLYSPGIRSKLERERMGIPKDLPAFLRPVYGYMSPLPYGFDLALNAFAAVLQYGEVAVRLKRESVIDRATFTFGDSLSEEVIPSPVTNPSIVSVRTRAVSDVIDGLDISNVALKYRYIEAQYHGGVTLNDIDLIVFPEHAGVPEGIRILLDTYGIGYRVGRPERAAEIIHPAPPPEQSLESKVQRDPNHIVNGISALGGTAHYTDVDEFNRAWIKSMNGAEPGLVINAFRSIEPAIISAFKESEGIPPSAFQSEFNFHIFEEESIVMRANFAEGDFELVTMERNFAGRSAFHVSMDVEADLMGRGIAKSAMRAQIALYGSMGIREVQVLASAVGSYSWLKFGFIPYTGGFEDVQEGINERLMREEESGLTSEGEAEFIRSILNSDDPTSLWLLADSEYGLGYLLGLDWSGFFDLANEGQMARLEAYVGPIGRPLLPAPPPDFVAFADKEDFYRPAAVADIIEQVWKRETSLPEPISITDVSSPNRILNKTAHYRYYSFTFDLAMNGFGSPSNVRVTIADDTTRVEFESGKHSVTTTFVHGYSHADISVSNLPMLPSLLIRARTSIRWPNSAAGITSVRGDLAAEPAPPEKFTVADRIGYLSEEPGGDVTRRILETWGQKTGIIDAEVLKEEINRSIKEFADSAHMFIRLDDAANALRNGKVVNSFALNPMDIGWGESPEQIISEFDEALKKEGVKFRNLEFKLGQAGMAGSGTAQAEQLRFGIPRNAPHDARPIYGYLSLSPTGRFSTETRNASLDGYGRVAVKLKDSVRDRITFTFGDSFYAEWGATLLNDPKYWGIPRASYHILERWRFDDPYGLLKKADTNPNWYVEAQIWGGITLDDIDYFILGDDDPALAMLIEAARVKYVELKGKPSPSGKFEIKGPAAPLPAPPPIPEYAIADFEVLAERNPAFTVIGEERDRNAAVEFWNRFMSDAGSPTEVLSRWFDPALFSGIDSRLKHVTGFILAKRRTGGFYEFELDVRVHSDPENYEHYDIQIIRILFGNDLGLRAEHTRFEVNSYLQARGISKAFMGRSYELYRRLGITYADIIAVDRGSYSWARYGFAPIDFETWDEVRKTALRRLAYMKPHIDPIHYAAIRKMLNESNHQSDIWHVSDIRTIYGPTGETLGVRLLTGNNWEGEIDFTDPDMKARFEAYIGLTKPPKRYEDLPGAALLPAPPPSKDTYLGYYPSIQEMDYGKAASRANVRLFSAIAERVSDKWLLKKLETLQYDDEETSKVEAYTQGALEGFILTSSFFVQFDPLDMELILSSGRLKSQFEFSPPKEGYFDVRLNAEKSHFGVPKVAPNQIRPVYGYIDDSEFGFYDSGEDISAYGTATIKLKKGNVFNYTTFRFGDLFQPGAIVSSAAKPSQYSIPIDAQAQFYYKRVPLNQYLEVGIPYVEAQYHGGVTLDDIELFIFDESEPPTRQMKDALNSKGMPWRVGRERREALLPAPPPEPPVPEILEPSEVAAELEADPMFLLRRIVDVGALAPIQFESRVNRDFSSLNDGQQSDIRNFNEVWLQALHAADPALIHRAFSELVEPLRERTGIEDLHSRARFESSRTAIDIEVSYDDPDTDFLIVNVLRSFDVRGAVTHEAMAVRDEFRSRGISKLFMESQVRLYLELGSVNEILTSATSIGGYTWLRHGFMMEDEDWRTVRGHVETILDDRKALALADAGEVKFIRAVIDNDDPIAAWTLADSQYGKGYLVGRMWSGYFNFDSEQQWRRLQAYLNVDFGMVPPREVKLLPAKPIHPSVLPIRLESLERQKKEMDKFIGEFAEKWLISRDTARARINEWLSRIVRSSKAILPISEDFIKSVVEKFIVNELITYESSIVGIVPIGLPLIFASDYAFGIRGKGRGVWPLPLLLTDDVGRFVSNNPGFMAIVIDKDAIADRSMVVSLTSSASPYRSPNIVSLEVGALRDVEGFLEVDDPLLLNIGLRVFGGIQVDNINSIVVSSSTASDYPTLKSLNVPVQVVDMPDVDELLDQFRDAGIFIADANDVDEISALDLFLTDVNLSPYGISEHIRNAAFGISERVGQEVNADIDVIVDSGLSSTSDGYRYTLNVSFFVEDTVESIVSVSRSFERRGSDPRSSIIAVDHFSMEVDEGYQQLGIARIINGELFKLYQSIGVSEITVSAANRGSYAWLRFGFIPYERSWKFIRGASLANAKTLLGDKKIGKRTFDLIASIAKSDDPRSAWTLADIRTKVKGDSRFVSEVILHNLRWSGAINMCDSDAVRRYQAYTRKKPKR